MSRKRNEVLVEDADSDSLSSDVDMEQEDDMDDKEIQQCQEHEAIAKSRLKPPLYTPIPSEFTGLQVKHLMSHDSDAPLKSAKVTIEKKQVIVTETDRNGKKHSMTFCCGSCFDVYNPPDFNNELVVDIRDGCVEGWRLRFKAKDEACRDALADALMRLKNNQLMAFNLLPDDRCAALGLKNSKLTKAQIDRMRADATPVIPKGTSAEFGRCKSYNERELSIGLLECMACPTMSRTSSISRPISQLTVGNGKIECLFPHEMTHCIEASEFLPPRLVTPPDYARQIFVCDSRDASNARQAWAFQVSRKRAAKLRDILMAAWIDVDGTSTPKTGTTKTAKVSPKKKVTKKSGGVKGGGVARKAAAAAPKKATPQRASTRRAVKT